MSIINITELKNMTGVGFGTSGIRNTAKSLTDLVVYAYTKAFLQFAGHKEELKNKTITVAGDYRESTDRILKVVSRAITDFGLTADYCGRIPTPAVMYYGMSIDAPSIMVTGSHIPADRNGVKYNLSQRELFKSDEAAITSLVVEIDDSIFDENGNLIDFNELPTEHTLAKELYIKRYTEFFSGDLLKGMKVGLYGHSSVAKELLESILHQLGIEVKRIDYSQEFVPVDTEVVEESLIEKAKLWIKEYGVDTLITTDGDGDRPLISDETGEWFRADTTGILTAEYLGAKYAVMPVSCNTAAEKSGQFEIVSRVKVGSPYVVEEMIHLNNQKRGLVIGYEANGGFLTIDEMNVNGNILKPLPTRDAVLVLLAVMSLARKKQVSLRELRLSLPARFTASSSIKGFPTEKALALVDEMGEGFISDVAQLFGEIESTNTTDGARFYFKNGDIIHFRPSRNSPEFRDYTESDTPEKAEELSQKAIELIKIWGHFDKNS